MSDQKKSVVYPLSSIKVQSTITPYLHKQITKEVSLRDIRSTSLLIRILISDAINGRLTYKDGRNFFSHLNEENK